MATVTDNSSHDHSHSHSHSDFSTDQASLRDLARNGVADEAPIYGYADMASNGQSNGVQPNQHDYLFSDAYPIAGLSNSFRDLEEEDPAALLESLASFEHPVVSNEERTNESNDHFASLLQAVATAGEETAQTDLLQTRESSGPSTSDTYGFFNRSFPTETRSKRKRNDPQESDPGFGFVSPGKRRKKTTPPDDEEELAREREIWGPPSDEEDVSTTYSVQHSPITTADLRAVGVHSAAALFRRPSAASKKYTRPPMSKLFTSLGLSAEQFLHLQAGAKAYMLDENYPERSGCVGNRGSIDGDMVKLKLFDCVKSFLDDEGWGERCFGATSEGAVNRKWKWPEMQNKLISLVTPLLRRMVTNERQRQYAAETRHDKRQRLKQHQGEHSTASPTPIERTPKPNHRHGISPTPLGGVEPKLGEYHYDVKSSAFPSENGDDGIQHKDGTTSGTLFPADEEREKVDIRYFINILQNGRRIRPKVTLTPSSCPGFSGLVQHIHNILNHRERLSSIKVLGPNGLKGVSDEETWRHAIASVTGNDWMDGEVKCVVHIEEKL